MGTTPRGSRCRPSLGGLAEFERELTPHISGGRSSSGLRKALGKPISPDPMACRRQPSAGWQPPKSPSASGVNRAASKEKQPKPCGKHCAKLILTCEKCHRLAAESGRILA